MSEGIKKIWTQGPTFFQLLRFGDEHLVSFFWFLLSRKKIGVTIICYMLFVSYWHVVQFWGMAAVKP